MTDITFRVKDVNPNYSRITVNNDDKWLKTSLFSVTYVRVNPAVITADQGVVMNLAFNLFAMDYEYKIESRRCLMLDTSRQCYDTLSQKGSLTIFF